MDFKQYRIIQAVSGKYYVQVEQQRTITKGYLFWKKKEMISEWVSLTRIGTIPYNNKLFKHRNNKAKGYNTLSEAYSFLDRLNKGTIVYGCY